MLIGSNVIPRARRAKSSKGYTTTEEALRALTHYVVAARGKERVSDTQELHTPDLAYAGIPGSRLRGLRSQRSRSTMSQIRGS